jgi:hypothetical protein
MKRYHLLVLFVLCTLTLSVTPSCKAKYGCPSNEQVQPKVNKRGELKTKRSKTKGDLFDKKMRKPMGH